MKIQSKFAKTFTLVFALTAASWLLAYGSAVMAGDRPFPKATLAKVSQGVNQSVALNLEKKAALTGIVKVEVQVGSADVEITRSEGKELVAQVTGDGPKGTTLEVNQEGENLTIRVETHGDGMRFDFGDSAKPMRLNVKLPAVFAGDLALKSGSGDITAGQLEVARLDVNVGSGDVMMIEVKAKATEAKTGSGDLELNKVSSGELKLSAGSGDIFVGELIAKSAEARTGSGDVTIQLNDSSNWSATARSGSGEIDSAMPGGEWNERRNRFKAGAGENVLNIETGSGDIKIAL